MTEPNTPAPATAAAVAGLAREVEGLRRRLDSLDGVSTRVKDLARIVTQLAAEVSARAATGSGREPATSWLDLPDDVQAARHLLDELVAWLGAVYLRYADARRSLPNCWLWHPDIVEELLWLMQSWQAAYRDDEATVSMAADWHDRYRSGVVKRIKELAGKCSLENHLQPEPNRNSGVPAMTAVPAIAQWWGGSTDHGGVPPVPTDEQLVEDDDRDDRQRGGRR